MIWYISYTVIYFILMFAMGIYYFFKIKTYDDYLIGSWNTGFWPIVGTIISTWCGAAVFIGWMGMGFTVGLSGFFKFALPGILFSLLLIIVFASPLRRQQLYTIADLFGERFGGRAGIIPSLLSAIIYSVPTLALQIVGLASIFNITLGLETNSAIILSFLLMLGFTILGGLPATIITDALQSIIVIIGIIVLAITSLNYAGGLENILANTPAEYVSPLGPEGLSEILLYALSVGPFYVVWQSTWQRIFASKSEEVAKKAGITGFLIAGAISFLPFSIGMIARQYVPLDMHPDLIFSYVTAELIPPAIGGIVFLGLMAALMTGATSFILQGSSNLTRDLYQRLWNPDADNKQLMFVARGAVVAISVLGVIVAFFVTDIATAYQWALRLSATVLLFPFLAVMFWRGITKKGMVWSMVLSVIATIGWPFMNIPIDHTVFGFSVSIISMVIISLLTNHDKTEQVRPVYWEDLDSANKDN
ncbi:solute:sodium symporter (SSS) family transporter [Thalassobacillus devorans]|uniref:Solute:sodium symporter (SSS) family transporter n=1 Tax=Thalassobacillus devorans TaxID=279813 RepID=A0ABQ1NY49_9BACI|nr:sodium:solute symporter family protein [Thalassobacillus devorans]NIK28547.1 SSS family solute:Na+ symporter [Thalassobacillus devorans]GGC85362.1 solute:sodium symporter (SSS) family transporter [Thalassobacillus devorans]